MSDWVICTVCKKLVPLRCECPWCNAREHTASIPEEPEYLTTETDAGFRAVITARVDEKHSVERRIHGFWRMSKLGLDDVILRARMGDVFRTKNPNFKPAPEPGVGQIWIHTDTTGMRRELLVMGFLRIGADKYVKAWCAARGGDFACWNVNGLIEFTGRTVDLSALEGDDE